MGTQVTCDLCRVVLKPGNRSPQRPRLIGLVPATSSGPFDEGIDDGSNDVELDLDVCKACLRRVVGMIRECFGSTCAPEFIESSAKFLVDTQDAGTQSKFPEPPPALLLVDGLSPTLSTCKHQKILGGRIGSSTTIVCKRCGDFYTVSRDGAITSGWRPAAEYAAALADAERKADE